MESSDQRLWNLVLGREVTLMCLWKEGGKDKDRQEWKIKKKRCNTGVGEDLGDIKREETRKVLDSCTKA